MFGHQTKINQTWFDIDFADGWHQIQGFCNLPTPGLRTNCEPRSFIQGLTTAGL
jgi:hypothetical protein